MEYVCSRDDGGNTLCEVSICLFLSCPGSALCQVPVFSFTIQKAQVLFGFLWTRRFQNYGCQ